MSCLWLMVLSSFSLLGYGLVLTHLKLDLCGNFQYSVAKPLLPLFNVSMSLISFSSECSLSFATVLAAGVTNTLGGRNWGEMIGFNLLA